MVPPPFVNLRDRDWRLLEESKAAFWRERTPSEAIRVADELRLYVLRMRPDWPDPEERAADLATHVRVSQALRDASRFLAR